MPSRPYPATALGLLMAVIGLILTIVFWAADTLAVTNHLAVVLVLAFLAILL